jgi:hypothetical protein
MESRAQENINKAQQEEEYIKQKQEVDGHERERERERVTHCTVSLLTWL